MTTETEARSDGATKIRDQIVASQDLKREPIDLAEWWPEVAGVPLFIRTMSAGERSRYEETLDFDRTGVPRSKLNIQAKLGVRVLVTEDGDRVFGDDDVEVLASKNSEAVQTIFELGAKVNGMTKEALATLEKNSGETPSAL